ncbi:hypothetical protein [Muricomes intestini]|jgi:hypothetical protein|uniref:Uncharacterized protein n=1 Tax=Muricomes intestini TaxID=1796634 RepID=A0A4R3KH20_9FIRM|nr:hypothetical protein [Muricomes intestini]TCS82664.1 hypothetical protein EDD59_10168 [Muricomes intestini]HAX52188.1 hypothetical protein [Lachnospiraceae bacterium]HCR84417.1 hypothetical protein [Lachnospiraceae bacterium]
MKKSKRILALIGAVLLICLYGSTLVFAIFDRSASADLLKISIAATIFVPVLLYAYGLIYRLSQNKKSDDTDEEP